MSQTLRNQRVLIIGGSSGIGLAVAKLIAAEAAKVTIASRSHDRLEKAAETMDGGVKISPINTLDEAAIKDFFAAQMKRILINRCV